MTGYQVRWRDEDRSWRYAEHSRAPNKGHRCEFPGRRQAKAWIRNARARWAVRFPVEIVHPDGTRELITKMSGPMGS